MSSLEPTQTNGTTDAGTDAEPVALEGTHEAGLRKALIEQREAAKALKAELDRIKAAQQDAERRAAEEQGRFKDLYEAEKSKVSTYESQLSEYQEREQSRLAALADRNTQRIEALPEQFKALVPEGLGPEAVAGWLDRVPVEAPPPPMAAGAKVGAQKVKGKIPLACVEQAQKYGKDPEAWFPIWSKTDAGRKWLAEHS